MKRICIKCKKIFDGKNYATLCPICATESKKSTYRIRTCLNCGYEFVGAPITKYCPDCMAERKKEQAKESRKRAKLGTIRKLGSIDICSVCGNEYIVNGPKQKYCKDCAEEAYKEVDRIQGREWAANNMNYAQRNADRQSAIAPIVCVVCGKEFYPHTAQITCSPECAKKNNAIRHKMYANKHKQHIYASRKANTTKKINAMTPEEYVEYRAKINAKARENYWKRKEKSNV